MKASYNTETKDTTITGSVGEFRCIGIALGLLLGGPGLATEMMQGVINAADNTSNDSDYQDRVEALFEHVRDEHADNDPQRDVCEMLRVMALALPRSAVMTEHFRQMGTSEPESFNA